MDTTSSLFTAIAAIVHHTPHRVWVILAAITALGLMQWREQRVSRARLLTAPLALAAYSLWGATSVLGTPAVPGWLAGLALALLAGQSLVQHRRVEIAADGRFVLAGSPWPLLLMWAVFALRYAVAVALVFHPELPHSVVASIGLAALYGALSGLFAARAWRVLQSARWPVTVQAA